MSHEEILDTVSEAFHYLQDSNLASVLSILLEGVTDDKDFALILLTNYQQIYDRVIKISLLDEDNDDRSAAIRVLINMSAHPIVCEKIATIENKEEEPGMLFWKFLKQFLKPQKMVFQRNLGNFLSNLTRTVPTIIGKEATFLENSSEIETLLEMAFMKSYRPPDGSVFERWPAASILLNLSQLAFVRSYIQENIDFLNDVKFLLAELPSHEWKRATFGLIKNLLRTSGNPSVYNMDCCVLSTVLFPLIGREEYESQETFPVFLPEPFAVKRIDMESDPELRILLLDALYLFAATCEGRTTMRDTNTYDILKRLHENQCEPHLNTKELHRCEDIIGLLIREEEEIGGLNLLNVIIPDDIAKDFNNENDLNQ